MKTLREVVPYEFFQEFMGTPAAKLLDVKVVKEYDPHRLYVERWPGKHKNVVGIWWELENGKAVGWNENPAIGWSFPVITLKKRTKCRVVADRDAAVSKAVSKDYESSNLSGPAK